MQKMGVEPTRYFYHTDLNRARLPIPPLLHSAALSGNGFIIPKVFYFVNKNFPSAVSQFRRRVSSCPAKGRTRNIGCPSDV